MTESEIVSELEKLKEEGFVVIPHVLPISFTPVLALFYRRDDVYITGGCFEEFEKLVEHARFIQHCNNEFEEQYEEIKKQGQYKQLMSLDKPLAGEA